MAEVATSDFLDSDGGTAMIAMSERGRDGWVGGLV